MNKWILFKMKLRTMMKIWKAQKFMAITGTAESFNVVTTYNDTEITRSGKAVYFH